MASHPHRRIKIALLPVRGGQWQELPLLKAIRDGDVPLVRGYIKSGVDANADYASLAPEVGGDWQGPQGDRFFGRWPPTHIRTHPPSLTLLPPLSSRLIN
jgi:hypothetical protein